MMIAFHVNEITLSDATNINHYSSFKITIYLYILNILYIYDYGSLCHVADFTEEDFL